MCGIAATFGGKDPITRVLACYENQKERGTDGFGFLALREGKIVMFDRHVSEKGIRASLELARAYAPDTILFHHRYPTANANVPESAHPLPISKKGWKYRYYMLHNGVVSGGDDVEDIESKSGYRFKSRVQTVSFYRAGGKLYERADDDGEVNDSEILGYYVASLLEGERQDIPMSGAIACIVLREDKNTKECTVFAMRNSMNPLKVFRGSKKDKKKGINTLLVSSENGGANLAEHVIHRLDWATLVFETEREVNIGKVYVHTYSHGKWEGMYGDGWKMPAGFGIGNASLLDSKLAHIPPVGVPARAVPAPLLAGGSSEDAIIAQEIERRTKDADDKYALYEEALAVFEGDSSAEVIGHLEALYRAWEAAEELRDEMVDSEADTVIIGDASGSGEKTGAEMF